MIELARAALYNEEETATTAAGGAVETVPGEETKMELGNGGEHSEEESKAKAAKATKTREAFANKLVLCDYMLQVPDSLPSDWYDHFLFR